MDETMKFCFSSLTWTAVLVTAAEVNEVSGMLISGNVSLYTDV
jgi:hypothetical protein